MPGVAHGELKPNSGGGLHPEAGGVGPNNVKTPGRLSKLRIVTRNGVTYYLHPGEKVPGLAAGGIIARAGRVIVGEKGREELDLAPPARVTPLPRAAGETPTIKVVLYSILDGKVVSSSVVDDLLGEAARE